MIKWGLSQQCKAGSALENQCNMSYQEIKKEKSYGNHHLNSPAYLPYLSMHITEGQSI